MHGKRQFSLFSVVLFLATFSTVLSFYPVKEIGDFFRKAFYILWFLLLYLMFQQNRRVYLDRNILWMILAYAGCFAATRIAIQIGDYPYNSTIGIARHIPYCVFFYSVGNNFVLDREKQITVLRAVLLGTAIISVETLTGTVIALQKNQLGQIMGAAILAASILIKHVNNRSEKVYHVLVAAVCIVSLWLIQSRTPVICLAIVFIARFIRQNNEKKHRFRSVGIAITAIVAFFVAAELHLLDGVLRTFSPDYGRYITVSEALHSKRALDILLSGRITVYEIAINDFKQHPLFGVGPWAYIDNFAFHCLRSGGIVYGLLLLPLVYGIMFGTTSKVFRSETALTSDAYALNKSIVWSFTLFYFLESLMEGYPPIGPGASAFLLWLMLGIGNRSLAEISVAKKSKKKAKTVSEEEP